MRSNQYRTRVVVAFCAALFATSFAVWADENQGARVITPQVITGGGGGLASANDRDGELVYAYRNALKIAREKDGFLTRLREKTLAMEEADRSGADALKTFAETLAKESTASLDDAALAFELCGIMQFYDSDLASSTRAAIIKGLRASGNADFAAYATQRDSEAFASAADGTFDESLLELPDEFDAAFALARIDEILSAIKRFGLDERNHAAAHQAENRSRETLAKLNRRILDESPEKFVDDPELFRRAVGSFAFARDEESLEKATALARKARGEGKSLPIDDALNLRLAMAQARLLQDKSAEARKAFVEAVVASMKLGSYSFANITAVVSSAFANDPTIRDETLAAVREAFESDESYLGKFYTSYFDGVERATKLVGETPLVEGIMADGSTLNWDEYRGKYVLLTFSSPWNFAQGPSRSSIGELCKKYGDSKLAIIWYVNDDFSLDLTRYLNHIEAPYDLSRAEVPEGFNVKFMSRLRSVRSKDLGGKEFVDLYRYYGNFSATERAILIDPNGKAIAVALFPLQNSDFADAMRNALSSSVDGATDTSANEQ